MVFEAGAFLLSVGPQHYFQEKAKRFCTPYVITVDQVTARGYVNCKG